MESFRKYLKNNIVLCDGAMGTLIYRKGVFIDKCYDQLNISKPELIQTIHQEYLNAGSLVIETNTFGANRYKLNKYNLKDQVSAINRAGVKLAKEVAQDKAYIGGSIGPLGIELEPWGRIVYKEAYQAFHEQVTTLLECGIDLFILETFHDLNEIKQAIQVIQTNSHLPIIAQMTIEEDGRTIYGNSIIEMVEQLTSMEVDVIGINCVLGPKKMLDFLEQMIQISSKPISIMPNAGRPQYVNGRSIYMTTPDYFGIYAKHFIEAGASVIGGCCGTTPEHIRKMSMALNQKQTRIKNRIVFHKTEIKTLEEISQIKPEKKSTLASKIIHCQQVNLVEMISPRGKDFHKQIEGALLLKKNHIDAINIPDGPRASARMNGLALAILLQQKVGIETVLHYTCRDRNILGIQSDMLGASVLGIKNILAITGDPPMMGDYPEATAVFDIDSIGLTRVISNLNRGFDIGNKLIGEPTGFYIGIGADPNAINMDREIQRFKLKIQAGAEFVITQPVFNIQSLEHFLEGTKEVGIPFIAGVWPLVNYRNAEFMKNEVPGVVIPDDILYQIGRYDKKEDQLKAGIEIAQEIVCQVRKITQGIQVSAPFGRYEVALKVLGKI